MNTLQSATSRLAAEGAVLEVWNSPSRSFLVGELQWMDPNRLFWFTAHGDRVEDGHVLDFDFACCADDGNVQFFRSGRLVGKLTGIAAANVEDPEDYTVAFSLWQQVAPRTHSLIERSRARFEPE